MVNQSTKNSLTFKFLKENKFIEIILKLFMYLNYEYLCQFCFDIFIHVYLYL